VHKLFEAEPLHPKPDFLTQRDAWSSTFEWVVESLDEARLDCPNTLPEIYSQVGLTINNSNATGAKLMLPPQDGSLPLSDLQVELIALMRGASEDTVPQPTAEEFKASWTEADGGAYVTDRMARFLA
jgi:hypothetical protein